MESSSSEELEREVMHEQLDYLIARHREHSCVWCADCWRYERVRRALLEIFEESAKPRARAASAGVTPNPQS